MLKDRLASQRNATRALVDKRISLLEYHLVELRQYRNSIASISLLSNDVLSQIFFEYVIATDPWSTKWTKDILFVCRRWYHLCMEDARLWSFISPERKLGRTLTRTWLKRSRDHPIRIRLSFNEVTLKYDGYFYNREILSENAHRIQSLEVETHSTTMSALFKDIESMPRLQQLKLECHTLTSLSQIPALFFNGGSPNLNDISIQDCAFIRIDHFTSLRNLTRLSLQYLPHHPVPPEALPPLSSLLEVLQQSPRLQDLTIKRYIRITSNEMAIDSQSLPLLEVPLPALEHLDIDLHIDIMVTLLRLIKHPPSTYLGLVPDKLIRASSPSFSRLLFLIGQHMRRPGAPRLRSVRINSHCWSSTSVFAHHTSKCPPSTSERNPYFSIFTYPFSQAQTRRILTKILNILPICYDDTSLYVNEIVNAGPDYLTVPSWVTVFNCIPVPLKIIAGNNEGTSAMLEGLIEVMKNPARKPGHRRIFDLQLSGLVILASSHPRYSHNGTDTHSRNYSNLVDLLTTYKMLHVPWKRGGKRVPMLEVKGTRGGYLEVYSFIEQLWQVCDQFLISGRDIHPAEIKNCHKRRVKDMKERRANGLEVHIPPEDEDLSDEEPVLPKPSEEVPVGFCNRIELLPDDWKHMHEEEFGGIIN